MTPMPLGESHRAIRREFWETAAKTLSRFYLGKKVAFVYRAKREIRGSKIRVIWGKITRTHGTFTREFAASAVTGKTNVAIQATPALSARSSDTTCLPRPLVPPFGSCCTHPPSR